ncbi:MAG: PIN domain-containing protein [Treponema sp.]|nr:PIN domain-containing protein [Treponema sp.]
MILVDTSVLINFFRGRETTGTRYLEHIISNDIPFCINEFIYQEILQGAKDEKEFSMLKSYLSEVPMCSLKLDIQSYENAATLNFRCRRKEITIRSTIDLLIAETAVENGVKLLREILLARTLLNLTFYNRLYSL